MEHGFSSDIESKGKKTVIIIISVIIVAAAGLIGYRQVMQWHENELKSAVLNQQKIMAQKNADLEYQILELKNKLEMHAPPPIPEDRIEAVFGKPRSALPAEADLSCDTLKQKINSFFSYLEQRSYTGENSEKTPRDVFFQMIRALAANPPVIADETRDIVSLRHNLAHFYRILKKDRIEMVKHILAAEDDVLEHAMADLYAYYAATDCCENDSEPCISLNTLYEYAGFFTNTFAGKSYLFRRQSAIRSLVSYYAILILDRANEAQINRYGIDIRPHIEVAIDHIANQNSLIFRDYYLDKLSSLQQKYNG